jgi:hypothetical protein
MPMMLDERRLHQSRTFMTRHRGESRRIESRTVQTPQFDRNRVSNSRDSAHRRAY